MSDQQPTNQEIIDAVQSGFSQVDKRIDGLDKRIDGLDKRIDGLDKRIGGLDKRIDGVDGRIDGLGQKINTVKLDIIDHVDNKFADLEGAIVIRQRKQDNKINRLIDALDKFSVLPKEELQAVRSIQIFPQASE